jgi:hypothetical protein
MTVQGTCQVIAMPTLSGRIALGEPDIRLGYTCTVQSPEGNFRFRPKADLANGQL